MGDMVFTNYEAWLSETVIWLLSKPEFVPNVPTHTLNSALEYFKNLEQYEKCAIIKTHLDQHPLITKDKT